MHTLGARQVKMSRIVVKTTIVTKEIPTCSLFTGANTAWSHIPLPDLFTDRCLVIKLTTATPTALQKEEQHEVVTLYVYCLPLFVSFI